MRRSLITMASVVGLTATTLAGAGTAQAATNDPFYGKLWGLQQIHAEEAWARSTGAGAVVAVVDTGIDFTQPDLQGQILPGATFTGCAGAAPCGNGDFRGPDGVNNGDEHGTHVAGTIAAVRSNGIGVVGVAPGAKILPVKVLEAGSGSSDDIAAGIRWAADNGADVINMSLGTIPGGQVLSISGLDAVMKDAISYARSKGVLTVAAAGNSSTALSTTLRSTARRSVSVRRTATACTATTPSCRTRQTRNRCRRPAAAASPVAMTTSGRRFPSVRAPLRVARQTTTRTPERPWRHRMSPASRHCCSHRAARWTVSSRRS